MSARMRLRRNDGVVYLDRWGIEYKPLFGIFLHRMDGADPSVDLHDHPWAFVSILIAGGYDEERADTRSAADWVIVHRRPLSARLMRLDECHTITGLHKRRSWSIVIHGPYRRKWGFYTPSGFMEAHAYAATSRGRARNLHAEISTEGVQ